MTATNSTSPIMTDDIEVGRFALRTFLWSPIRGPVSTWVSGDHWAGGVCEAKCYTVDDEVSWTQPVGVREWRVREPQHEVPQEDCDCGVYGALSLYRLRVQYPRESAHLVTVIAPEGRTIIGDRGLRAQLARVVGFWTPERDRIPLCQEKFPDAQYHEDLTVMLTSFNIPKGEPESGLCPCLVRELMLEERGWVDES
jgi:hypothetical protein